MNLYNMYTYIYICKYIHLYVYLNVYIYICPISRSSIATLPQAAPLPSRSLPAVVVTKIFPPVKRECKNKRKRNLTAGVLVRFFLEMLLFFCFFRTML